ncbi:MAG: hypothetical protein AVDCRST_MAG26-336, partial [uncultured Chloroflexia bacterium]
RPARRSPSSSCRSCCRQQDGNTCGIVA